MGQDGGGVYGEVTRSQPHKIKENPPLRTGRKGGFSSLGTSPLVHCEANATFGPAAARQPGGPAISDLRPMPTG